jgi:hypothetical protein
VVESRRRRDTTSLVARTIIDDHPAIRSSSLADDCLDHDRQIRGLITTG